ncbi:hypothetical protein LOTGIDRAFT_114998 [Lottia gigantea]|uniref:UBA domain-containing protein n=1 Tax=Lottia gigantea TaxID=225164 RepID=V4ATZ2_LOTGI|nr:hypothetical protein LOTGIDRAFT_114998 [Lottia gigantea]ESO97246.1 hypothetical protein LOTGIDRAFT_114998 [Lottia gigantea]
MAAVAVPPRSFNKHGNKSHTPKNEKDSLEILMQMGFPENRALKSLASTGDKGVQLASDWLLSHVNDITLDEKVDRDYILYLCPVGGLQAELNAFWEKSQNLCGWNGAHAYFPHVTLCGFFKVSDNKLKFLTNAFSNLEAKIQNLPPTLKLEFFAQTSFIGLFIGGEYYDILKKLVEEFAAEVKKGGVDILEFSGIIMEPPKKQFHISCAYQYTPEHHDTLCKLAHEIHLNCDTRWDLRLYSRDPKVGKFEVRKVLRPYQPKMMDELELVIGDYILIDPSEVSNSADSWYNGVLWSTGVHGAFPGTFTKRTAETWTWTLHKTLFEEETCQIMDGKYVGTCKKHETIYLDLCFNQIGEQQPLKLEEKNLILSVSFTKTQSLENLFTITWIITHNFDETILRQFRSIPLKFKEKSVEERNGIVGNLFHTASDPVYAKVHKDKKHKHVRNLFVMRHGERIDFCFGRDWTENVFDEDGKYHRNNLNLPKTMYKRKNHLEYIRDSPLSETGKHQARLTGAAFREENVSVSHIFASPALRCVETAQAFLEGLICFSGGHLKICIEPSLFEYLGWYHPIIPIWMKPEELHKQGFKINTGYTPFLAIKDMNLDESIQECYDRTANFSRFVVKKLPPDGGNILLVAHAGSLDMCTHQLCGLNAKSATDFHLQLTSIPYCGLCMVQEDMEAKKWIMKEPPIPSLIHGSNRSFDYKLLQANFQK